MTNMRLGYGPSETTNICTVKKMAPGDNPRHLGHTLDNTSVVVLGQGRLDAVPLGFVGELCFGGEQVAVGYLNSPSLTAESFIQQPPFGRLYRSGDLGRMLPDGSLVIMGRKDDQVKLRGQRVELGEITAAAAHSDNVSAAVTLVLSPKNVASQQLIVFYVPKTGRGTLFAIAATDANLRTTGASLFRTLRASLPGYMIPSHVVPISALPLTPAGKIDKALLRKVFEGLTPENLEATSESLEAENDQDAEWGEIEQSLGAALSDTFGVDSTAIRLWTPFSALGLDSISAIRLARLLRERHGWRLPVSAILKNASIAQLSREIVRQRSGEERICSLDVFSLDFRTDLHHELRQRGLVAERILPCTPLQEAMLATSSSQQAYFNKMVFRIRRTAEDMRRWWSVVSQRHGILRTCFVTTDNPEYAIAQVVLEDHLLDWEELTTSTSDLTSCLDQQAQRLPPPTNSYRPPVSFATVQDGDEVFLCFFCHHALYDGQAVSRLLFEVEQITLGQALPDTPTYDDFLSQSLCLPSSADDFWAAQLHGFQPVLLQRIEDKRASRQHSASRTLGISLADLERRLMSAGTTLLSACQASWAITLMVLAKTDDVCFGNVFSGRSVPVDRVDELVAPCFNTVPLRVCSTGVKLNGDLINAVQELNIATLDYQFTPLRRIQRQSFHGNVIFNTLLLLQTPARPLNDEVWILEKDEGDMGVSSSRTPASFPVDAKQPSVPDGLRDYPDTLGRQRSR